MSCRGRRRLKRRRPTIEQLGSRPQRPDERGRPPATSARVRTVAHSVRTIEDGDHGGGRLVLTASGESGANSFLNPLPRRETVTGSGFPRGPIVNSLVSNDCKGPFNPLCPPHRLLLSPSPSNRPYGPSTVFLGPSRLPLSLPPLSPLPYLSVLDGSPHYSKTPLTGGFA